MPIVATRRGVPVSQAGPSALRLRRAGRPIGSARACGGKCRFAVQGSEIQRDDLGKDRDRKPARITGRRDKADGCVKPRQTVGGDARRQLPPQPLCGDATFAQRADMAGRAAQGRRDDPDVPVVVVVVVVKEGQHRGPRIGKQQNVIGGRRQRTGIATGCCVARGLIRIQYVIPRRPAMRVKTRASSPRPNTRKRISGSRVATKSAPSQPVCAVKSRRMSPSGRKRSPARTRPRPRHARSRRARVSPTGNRVMSRPPPQGRRISKKGEPAP